MPYKKTNLTCGIYSITSPSGKFYIGSTANFRDRWRRHRINLEKGIHPNKILQNAWKKYDGKLEFKPLFVCEPKDLLFYEQLCFDKLNPAYNIVLTAENTLGYRHTEETKERLRNAWKRRPLGPRNSKGQFIVGATNSGH